jgi:hypothetical protein
MLWIRDVNRNTLDELPGMSLEQMAKAAMGKGPCLTLLDGGEAIACGGVVTMFSTSGEIWLRLSKKAGPHAVRELKTQMYRWISELKLNRLQATGPAAWKELPRFLEWLGMQREGILRRFGPNGDDYFIYSWVRQ